MGGQASVDIADSFEAQAKLHEILLETKNLQAVPIAHGQFEYRHVSDEVRDALLRDMYRAREARQAGIVPSAFD